MTFEIGAIIVLAALVVLLIFSSIDDGKDILDLKQDLADFKSESKYNLLLPKITEYAKLSGYPEYFFRDRDSVYFSNYRVIVKLSEIEEKLADLKKAIAISCPEKCATKKKSK